MLALVRSGSNDLRRHRGQGGESLEGTDLGPIRYQFLHRTASAVLEAERCGAAHAVMLVHSFSNKATGFSDYAAFAALFGLEAEAGDANHCF